MTRAHYNHHLGKKQHGGKSHVICILYEIEMGKFWNRKTKWLQLGRVGGYYLSIASKIWTTQPQHWMVAGVLYIKLLPFILDSPVVFDFIVTVIMVAIMVVKIIKKNTTEVIIIFNFMIHKWQRRRREWKLQQQQQQQYYYNSECPCFFFCFVFTHNRCTCSVVLYGLNMVMKGE